MTKRTDAIVPLERIESRILLIRGQKVILDRDLADFYEVKPIALRQAVKRNLEKFPPDFMFQLSREEAETLVSQSVIPSLRSLGGSLPYVFTEHGALQLSSVLRSTRATHVGLFIVRAFVKLRQLLATHRDLADKLTELERAVIGHDQVIAQLVDAIKRLMEPPLDPNRKKIGFRSDPE